MQLLHHMGNAGQMLFKDQAAYIIMAKAGAFAHCFDLAFAAKFIAQCDRKQAFDQIGTLTTACRCFAAGPHCIQIMSAVIDAGNNLSFGNAVAAANL